MSNKIFRRGGRFSTEQHATSRETCIDCPACLACMTRTVTLKYCTVCRSTYLGIMNPEGGLIDTFILLDKKHARLCQQKRAGNMADDAWTWVCERCMERNQKKKQDRADRAIKNKLKGITLEDGYSGEDEW